MTKNEFKKWVREMVKRYRLEKRDKGCGIMAYNYVVICIDSNRNIGIAKCHPDDDYNIDIGTAIAYARCKGIEVPKVATYKKLSEMKNGEMFKDMFGYTYRYIGKNGVYPVSYCLEDKRYCTMPFNIEYEMVD